jgi:hypothetical protein
MGGSLHEDEVKGILSNEKYSNVKNFVETGTYKADTTILASKFFDNVYTTEIIDDLYNDAIKRADSEGINNIKFMLGDSVNLLEEIMTEIQGNATVFFLDAHISGSDSGWNLKQRVPLLEELNVILKHKLEPSVFILDDMRFWKGKENQVWDWEHISDMNIIKIFIDNGYKINSFYEKNDRFYVFTGECDAITSQS